MLPLTLLLLIVAVTGQFVCPRDDEGNCINGNLPNPLDCTTFYQCSNCFAYLQACQGGLHYSPRVDACVYPQEAKCQVSPDPTMSTIAMTMITEEVVATTEGSYTTGVPPIEVNRTVLFVGRQTAKTNRGLVEFTPIIDAGNEYDQGSNVFRVKRDGIYFQSISAGAFDSSFLNMNLVSPSATVDIYRASTAHDDHDTTSRDTIFNLSAGQIVYVTSDANLYSDQLLSTSWTAIGLTDMMNNTQAFSVGRTSGYVGNMDPLTFDRVLTNVGGGFDSARSVYVAPVDGIYFFSVSIGAATNSPLRASLFVDHTQLIKLTRESTSHTGPDTLSRAVLVRLARNQEVRVALLGNTAIYSDSELQTSFTGFLYDPILANRTSVWSLGKDAGVDRIDEYLKAIDFDKVILDEENAWDPNEKAVIAPYSGYYYIHISAGAVADIPVHLFFNVNEETRVDLWRAGVYHDGTDTLSRSALVRLAAGDRLEVGAATATALFSDNGAQTSFSGFFVCPDDETAFDQ